MSSLAIIKDDRYLEHNPGDGHPESPNRLRVIHDLINREFGNLRIIPPRMAEASDLALVHDTAYIRTVAATEGKAHSQLDPDTGLSARSYEIACLAAGGLLQGVDALFQTPNSEPDAPNSVFAFVRPPGHHAEPSRGMGFCLFNNIAIAAAYAKKQYGLKRILIVDWDLHHGNGTQRAFYDDPAVLFFSSHQYPYYPGSGGFDEVGIGKGEGFTVNAPLPTGFGDREYIRLYRKILQPIALEYDPELILVSAGFDPFEMDPLGGMQVTGAGFGALAGIVRDIAEETKQNKILITLEGGYNPEGLRNGVRAVLRTLLDQSPLPPKDAASPAADGIIRKIAEIQARFWTALR